MRECDVEKAICDYVKKKGGIAYKFTSPQRRSVPDRMVLLPRGVVLFIEFKAPGKKPTESQEREMLRMQQLGQFTYVIDDIVAGKVLIDGYSQQD